MRHGHEFPLNGIFIFFPESLLAGNDRLSALGGLSPHDSDTGPWRTTRAGKINRSEAV